MPSSIFILGRSQNSHISEITAFYIIEHMFISSAMTPTPARAITQWELYFSFPSTCFCIEYFRRIIFL